MQPKQKVPTFAEVVRAAPGGGAPGPPLVARAVAAAADRAVGGGATAAASDRSGPALLIYLREPTLNSANDIKIMLKKYFEPQRIGLQEVIMKEIRNGIAIQSQSLETLQRLADAINEHPNTKEAFVLRQPTKRKPQFRVSGVDPDILPAEFLTTLRAQNPEIQIQANEFYLRTTYKEKSGNCTHIFDVTAEGYQKLQGN